MPIFLVLMTLLLAGMRVAGFTHEAFQAAAHLWVGYLIGGAIYNAVERKTFIGLAGFLTVVEVICFFAFKH